MLRLPFVVGLLVAVACAGCVGDDARQPLPTGRIDGAVLDQVLTPYAGAAVHLIEMDRWTNTTQQGGFSFANLPDGFHTMEATVEGVGMKRGMVTVEEGGIARIILQIWAVAEPVPHVTDLHLRRHLDMAEPGGDCPNCGVTGRLDANRPQEVVAHAAWDPYALGPQSGMVTRMVMQVVDERGRVLLEPILGVGEMVGRIDMQNVPADTDSLFLEFWFPEDNPYHPDFEMESFLHLCYYDSCESLGLSAA